MRKCSPSNTGGTRNGAWWMSTLGAGGADACGDTYPSSDFTIAPDGAAGAAGAASPRFRPPQSTFTLRSAGWMACFSCFITLACMLAASVTNCAVPFPARASPSTRWWLTAFPIPSENTRECPLCCSTSLITSFVFDTCPSVSTNTCRGYPWIGRWWNTCDSGFTSSVPPRFAPIDLIAPAAVRSVPSSYLRDASNSVTCRLPNPTMLK
mmetsp:Transcript_24192/g.67749  ORF Transcript_24192/g.67749 Transcript_24192/m.67749 type:complete len:209 (-) Transcript_24192:1014-1640(-)